MHLQIQCSVDSVICMINDLTAEQKKRQIYLQITASIKKIHYTGTPQCHTMGQNLSTHLKTFHSKQ